MLAPPLRLELVQRLTALDICVTSAADIAVVRSLAALRHLQMGAPAGCDLQLVAASAGSSAQECQLRRLRTLQLGYMPPAAFFVDGIRGRLPMLHSLRLIRGPLPDGALPSDALRLQSLSRLELLQMPLRMMPDLRKLGALRVLVISQKGDAAGLDASQEACNAELRAALKSNPLGGATGLTEAVLHNMPIVTRACAEAVERLPHLRVLGLEFALSNEGAFWAATLQRRMRGRCQVLPAPCCRNSLLLGPHNMWADNDW
jgi:hypothetical protein